MVKHHASFITAVDQGAINLLHPLIDPTSTRIISSISNLASPIMMTVYALAIAAYLGHKQQFRTGLNFLILFSAFNLLNHVVKSLIERPRPLHRLVSIGGFSFPSGHTFATIILVYSITALTKRFDFSRKSQITIAIIGWLLILLVAFTRIFLHVHFFQRYYRQPLVSNSQLAIIHCNQ
ncbi:phosphatidylglycerophosphatase B [Ligilactobacillus acidipiscis DSM 15836]|uniref:Phosphatidylglycerophosphatase B n=1 Tax=Ligilactobacillus acidipiscis DSM 15836 TaxID=1423716 RepID=A0ABR5PIM5_9LACO|nr:phosphatidylglycerophosphatase B [Ligilactobacillus acidipiscis DSM 15836]